MAIDTSTRTRDRRPTRNLALLVGVVLVALGVLGFVPGVTTHYGLLAGTGPGSGALLFGVFPTSVALNLIHVATGALGLAVALPDGPTRAFLMWGGGAYLGLWAYGLAADQHRAADFGPFDAAVNWLHLGTAIAMFLLGYFGTVLERNRGQYPD